MFLEEKTIPGRKDTVPHGFGKKRNYLLVPNYCDAPHRNLLHSFDTWTPRKDDPVEYFCRNKWLTIARYVHLLNQYEPRIEEASIVRSFN
jgi:hypothetical protein